MQKRICMGSVSGLSFFAAFLLYCESMQLWDGSRGYAAFLLSMIVLGESCGRTTPAGRRMQTCGTSVEAEPDLYQTGSLMARAYGQPPARPSVVCRPLRN